MSKQIVGHFTEFVGGRIANRRKKKKITPEEFARKIGVSTIVLENMERGHSHINLEQLMLCVKYLSSTGDLLGLPYYSDEDMKAFVDARVNAMSEEELRAWKADTTAADDRAHRLFVLDLDDMT